MIEAVQAEQLGVVAARHHVEGALGGGAVAGELRRLGAEQQGERLAGRDAVGLVGEFAGGAHVAGGDRDQAVRHRLIAAHAAAGAQIERQHVGRADERADSDHSRTAATTTAATAATSTITEVSMRQPCQVMATSPGRSANQTAPKASPATIRR